LLSFETKRLKKLLSDISKWFFLLLFLEFFGSSTFFSHAHIVDGYTIVHSHPFKHDSKGAPIHDHPLNAYLLINLLIHFSAVVLSFWFTASLFISLQREIQIRFYPPFRLQKFQTPDYYRGPPQISI
jgi:hypothetical protein